MRRICPFGFGCILSLSTLAVSQLHLFFFFKSSSTEVLNKLKFLTFHFTNQDNKEGVRTRATDLCQKEDADTSYRMRQRSWSWPQNPKSLSYILEPGLIRILFRELFPVWGAAPSCNSASLGRTLPQISLLFPITLSRAEKQVFLCSSVLLLLFF